MPLPARTYEEIRDGILRDIRLAIPGAQTAEGTDAWANASAIAQAIMPQDAAASFLQQRAFPHATDPDGLQKWAAQLQLPAAGSRAADGYVTLTASGAATQPDGSTLTDTTTGAKYRTVGATTISGSPATGTAAVVAMQVGPSSDRQIGATLQVDSPAAGVSSTATVIAITGGQDAWDNERWATELRRRIRRPPHAGNVAHVQALAMSVPGVEMTFVYPALRGAGGVDVVVTSSGRSGSRRPPSVTLDAVVAALQNGVEGPSGEFIPGLPEDVFAETRVASPIAQTALLSLALKPNAAQAFTSWPPCDSTHQKPGTSTSWYVWTIPGIDPTNVYRVTKPTTGTVVAPTVGAVVGFWWSSVGFAKSTVRQVTDNTTYWTLVMDPWSPTPSDADLLARASYDGALVHPWSTVLQVLSGPPSADAPAARTGIIEDFYDSLGPGEMTAVVATETTRYRRHPALWLVNPLSGNVEWPTDITGQLSARVVLETGAQDGYIEGGTTVLTPTIPSTLGDPPRLLAPSRIQVIPY